MKKIALVTALAASVAVASPAMAWGDWKPRPKPPVSTSSGGGTSSGGHAVPEPGMLGMMGAGLIGLAVMRRRKARK